MKFFTLALACILTAAIGSQTMAQMVVAIDDAGYGSTGTSTAYVSTPAYSSFGTYGYGSNGTMMSTYGSTGSAYGSTGSAYGQQVYSQQVTTFSYNAPAVYAGAPVRKLIGLPFRVVKGTAGAVVNAVDCAQCNAQARQAARRQRKANRQAYRLMRTCNGC